MKTQKNLTPQNIEIFKSKLFDSWNDATKVFHSDEISVLVQLTHNVGVMTKKELSRKVKLSEYKLSNSIEGLLEEGLIDTMKGYDNELFIYLKPQKFNKIIGL